MIARALVWFTLALSACGQSPGSIEAEQRARGFSGPGFTHGGGGTVSLAGFKTGIPGSESGQTFAWDGTNWKLDSYQSDPSLRYSFVEEWETVPTTCNPSGKWLGAAQGTGGQCGQGLGEAAHPGIWGCQMGTTTTGACRTVTTAGAFTFGSSIGQSCVESLVKVPTLSTVGDEYLFQGGFAEPTAFAESVDAVEWIYDRLNTGDFWGLKNCSNSICTLLTCDGANGTIAAAVTAGAWTKIKVCENGAGTASTMTVNGTLCATNTTNIPTGTTRQTGLGLRCQKSAGTTSLSCLNDYMWATLPFGSAR